jgi:hypothetical protein
MSLNMLIEFGDAFDFTGAQFTEWCKEAGFSHCEIIQLAGPASAAVAYKWRTQRAIGGFFAGRSTVGVVDAFDAQACRSNRRRSSNSLSISRQRPAPVLRMPAKLLAAVDEVIE